MSVTHASRSPAGQKPANAKNPELVDARNAAAQIKKLVLRVPGQLAALQAARELADPLQMRTAANNADLLAAHINLAWDILEAGLDLHPPDAKKLTEASDVAWENLFELKQHIDQTRLQADRLDHAINGPLAVLPHEDIGIDPHDVRRQANLVAPPGLCDDPTMQSPTSRACPLEAPSREANRDLALAKLESIGNAWFRAIQTRYTDKRIEPILRGGGSQAIVELLVSMAAGWVGGLVVGAVIKAVAPKAGQIAGELSKFDVSDVAAPAQRNSSHEILIGLGTKVGEYGGKQLVKRPPGPDAIEKMFSMFGTIADAWKTQATIDVRQLSDPGLVALASGLQSHPFNYDWFLAKIDALLHQFELIDTKLGHGENLAGRRMETRWVVHPSGAARLALVRRETEWKAPAHRNSRIAGMGDDYEVDTGHTTFVAWVDKGLTETALNVARERHVEGMHVMSGNDTTWANPHEPDLERWNTNPSTPIDIKMFEGTEP